MEQVIQAEVVEQMIRNQIEEEYQVTILQKEETAQTKALWQEVFGEDSEAFISYYYEYKANENTVFVIKKADEIIAMLHLTPYSAAIRRNPPLPGANRLPCMADVVRVDTNYIVGVATKESHRHQGCMKKIMQSALAYQNRMNIPFAFLMPVAAALYEPYGFHYIYDKEEYELNQEQISHEMLYRAMKGEKVSLLPSTISLSVVDKSELLTLAHFVNANLCKKYGLFTIRSAVYYERLQREIISENGNIFLVKENGKIKGYFTWAKEESEFVQEAIFENRSDLERYFYAAREKKPAIMARIINMKQMLKHITSNGKVTIAVRIIDPVIAENDGLFIWYLDEKGSRLERMEEPQGEEAMKMRPELTVTIGELTAYFFEYIKLKESLKFDSIQLSGIPWINEIV